MTELLKKTLPDRKNIERHMINNVRMCARQKKLELEFANIEINPKHFDPIFIPSVYKDTTDNHFKGKYILYFFLLCVLKLYFI